MTENHEPNFQPTPEEINADPNVVAGDRIMSAADARFHRTHLEPSTLLSPAERESLREISIDQVHMIIEDAKARAEVLFEQSKNEAREHPSNSSLVNKVERAAQYSDRITTGWRAFYESENNLSDAEKITAANHLLTLKEEMEELLAPPEHWVGTKVHDGTDASSYEEAIAELEQPASTETEDVFDQVDPSNIVSGIEQARNRLTTKRSAIMDAAQGTAEKLVDVDAYVDRAHDLIRYLKRFSIEPKMSPERIELEQNRVRRELRDIETKVHVLELEILSSLPQ